MSANIPNIKRDTLFDIIDLPPRAIPLNLEQMSKVFGGCADLGEICRKGGDCCSGNCRVDNQPLQRKRCSST